MHTIGKGREERRTPLVPATRKVLKAWLKERGGAPTDPLFPTTTGKHLSRDAIDRRLARHLTTAAQTSPSLKTKQVTMALNMPTVSAPNPPEQRLLARLGITIGSA